ncbi:hypothetical protein WJ32_00155 [Burkholderia ubonensis]|uniref:Uncharacterized protein n=1 Tax=Burkholderia ubonensis TaxID=101571 RepID=A0A103QXJ9_9BURK|nr:hypothetical protein WJ32_00155 [Burkholderia ubonensis]KVG57407.1 hypothetical protein WJ33_34815 [Burkholderia ubonensis]
MLATFSPDDFATGGMYVRRPRVLPGLLAVMGPQWFRVFDARVTAMAPDLSNGFDLLCIYT